MKKHLLIKTRNEKRKGLVTLVDGDKIAQFFIFSENNLNYHTLIKQNKDYVYELTSDQHKRLKVFKISQVSKMTKKEIFIFCGMEEHLI